MNCNKWLLWLLRSLQADNRLMQIICDMVWMVFTLYIILFTIAHLPYLVCRVYYHSRKINEYILLYYILLSLKYRSVNCFQTFYKIKCSEYQLFSTEYPVLFNKRVTDKYQQYSYRFEDICELEALFCLQNIKWFIPYPTTWVKKL